MSLLKLRSRATDGGVGTRRLGARRVVVAPLVVALVALALAPAPVTAEISTYLIDTGPLRIRDQFMLGMGFLAFDPVSADVLEKGEWQLDLIETVTNDFARSDVVKEALEGRDQRAPLTLEQLRAINPEAGDGGIFFVDGELYRTAVAVRRGVGKGVQLELVVPVLSFQGGIVDSLIQEFRVRSGRAAGCAQGLIPGVRAESPR